MRPSYSMPSMNSFVGGAIAVGVPGHVLLLQLAFRRPAASPPAGRCRAGRPSSRSRGTSSSGLRLRDLAPAAHLRQVPDGVAVVGIGRVVAEEHVEVGHRRACRRGRTRRCRSCCWRSRDSPRRRTRSATGSAPPPCGSRRCSHRATCRRGSAPSPAPGACSDSSPPRPCVTPNTFSGLFFQISKSVMTGTPTPLKIACWFHGSPTQ